ncbi:MAG: amidohydrolase family protein, partial [Lachnospiraceae bacterium]|nr:amidohydrolase family protein [Lachnospiraceae bacterium]
AHMGSWGQWDKGFQMAREFDVYVDTAFTFKPRYLEKLPHEEMDCRFMEQEEFVKWVKKTGPDRILFGTDSPWSGQEEYLEEFKALPLTFYEKKRIFGDNAAELLGIA